MRPLAIVRAALPVAAAVIAMLAPAALAQAPAAPSVRYAVGSPGLAQAQAIARAYWGVDPCGGAVTLSWTRLAANVNALSSWTVTAGAYEHPESNGDCLVELNTAMAFTWPKLCTVVVHEYGHLAGRPHDPAGGRLMSAIYTRPVPECAPPKLTRRGPATRRSAPVRRAA